MAKAREIPGLHASASYAEAAAATVAVRADELFERADDVLDIDDIEAVHDMRVATRRLRAVLEIYEPCFPRKQHKEALSEVKALADALGERRDPDVLLAALDKVAMSVKSADFAGVALYAERVRARQWRANDTLRQALARVEERDLRGRLDELVRAAGDGAA